MSSKVFIPTKFVEEAQTRQYSPTGAKALIYKFTALNNTANSAEIKVYITKSGDLPSADTLVSSRLMYSGHMYNFPEVAGHILESGDSIYTECSEPDAIVIRMSGKEFS